jgi:hydrogenase-4 component B
MAESKSAALPLGDAPNRDAVNRSAAPRRKAQLPARAERLLSSGCDSPRPDRARSGADPLTAPALSLLALIVAALLIVGAGAAVLPRRRVLFTTATAALSGLGILASLIGLLGGAARASLAIPLGLPGGTILLALDPLSGFFLLLLFVSATACAVFALEPHGAESTRSTPFFPVFIAAMALTLLAGDAYALVFGFELMSLASWAMVLARHEEAASRDAALFYLGMAAFGAACLIPALALLAPAASSGLDLRFTAMRAAPPEGWRAGAVLVLVLLGAGSKAGLAPLHVWLPLAHPAAPSHVSALMSGAMTKVALYVVIRLVLDLCGPVQPLWWGVPLLAMGAASAVLGALRANTEPDLKTILAASTIENVGFIAIGIGLAVVARAADLPGLAALALGGAMLHALNHGVFKTLLFLGAGAVQHGAGSRLLELLGGLIHAMPVTTYCVMAGCVGLAALPPGPGFASEWLLFQAVLAAPRAGGLALQTAVTVVAALMALAAALAAAASVRLIGVAFLGRPRTPRAASALEAGRPARFAMLGMAGLTAVLGLLPGPALWLAEPALRALTGAALEGRAGTLTIAPMIESPGYAALAIALLLAIVAGLTLAVIRRWTVRGHRRGPAWGCGFAASPPWLPFGDPLTQYSGASFAQPLRRSLGGALLAAREHVDLPAPADPRPARLAVEAHDPADTWLFRPLRRVREVLAFRADRMQYLTIRRTLAVIFAVLVLFLAAIAWLEAS